MLCNSLNIQRRREVYLRLNAIYIAVISAIWPLNGAGKFDFLCDFTMNGRREVCLRLNAYYIAIIPVLWPDFLKYSWSALELYFSSLRGWILMKFGIQNPYAIDKLTLKRYQNTLTEWGEINYFVRPSGFFDDQLWSFVSGFCWNLGIKFASLLKIHTHKIGTKITETQTKNENTKTTHTHTLAYIKHTHKHIRKNT